MYHFISHMDLANYIELLWLDHHRSTWDPGLILLACLHIRACAERSSQRRWDSFCQEASWSESPGCARKHLDSRRYSKWDPQGCWRGVSDRCHIKAWKGNCIVLVQKENSSLGKIQHFNLLFMAKIMVRNIQWKQCYILYRCWRYRQRGFRRSRRKPRLTANHTCFRWQSTTPRKIARYYMDMQILDSIMWTILQNVLIYTSPL